MNTTDYWKETIESSFEEHGIQATNEQIASVASDIEISHDNYDLAFYQPSRASHTETELKRAKEDLAAERSKVLCKSCKGTGEDIGYGPSFVAISQCIKCCGQGRHLP